MREHLQEYLAQNSTEPAMVGDFIVIMAEDVLDDQPGGQRVRIVTSESHTYRLEGLAMHLSRFIDEMVESEEAEDE